MVVVESAQSPRLDRTRERDRPRHLIGRLGPIKALIVGSEPIAAIAVRIHLHRVTVRPNLRVAMPAEHVAAMGRKAIEAVQPPSHMDVHREVVREAEGIVRVVQQPGPSESGQTVSLIG